MGECWWPGLRSVSVAHAIPLGLCARVAARPHTHTCCPGYPDPLHSSGRSREAEEPVFWGTESPLRSRPTERKVGSAPGRPPDLPAPLPSRAQHPHGTQHPGACIPASVCTQARWEVPEQEESARSRPTAAPSSLSPSLGSGRRWQQLSLGPCGTPHCRPRFVRQAAVTRPPPPRRPLPAVSCGEMCFALVAHGKGVENCSSLFLAFLMS